MAKHLALEWDSREARVAVASTRGTQLVLEQAFSVPLEASEGGDESAERVGERIGAALAARRIPRLDTMVAVGRASIELKHLQLPPAPDEDLPDLVRFQAQREFNTLGADWPLDFVPLNDSPSEPRTVLAAAIAPDLVAQIERTCVAARQTAQRLVLRPYAAASLYCRRQTGDAGQVVLLVDLLSDEADLTVLFDGRVIYLRTARVRDPLSAPEAVRGLLGEIRRTLPAVQNQLGGRRVERVQLCGTLAEHAALTKQIEDEIKLPVAVFDPWEGLTRVGELREALPARAGRFAPLLGLLADEAAGAAHALDFLHPRRRPPPPSRRKQFLLAGAIAAGVALLVGGGFWWRVWSLGAEIDALARQSQSLKAAVTAAEQTQLAAADIEKWRGGNVVWLDELDRLAEKLPPADEVMLTSLSLSLAPEPGGNIALKGLARDPAAINGLAGGLRDEGHRVSVDKRSYNDAVKPYNWQFDSTLAVAPREEQVTEEQPAEEAPAENAAAAADDQATSANPGS